MAQRLSGRLELTWTNKDQRLLAHEDGSYEWVPPGDYRVAEVRLLHDAATVGETHGVRRRAEDNLLIRGDALAALTSLSKLPEFSHELVGKVRLAYLDPPFNTQQAFAHYDDALEHSVWLTMMRDRLALIADLLAPNGSLWLHLNDDEASYAKVVLDEIFGRGNHVATFVWRKVDSPSENKQPVAVDHDFILCYAKTAGTMPFTPMPDPSVANAFGKVDEASGRRYRDRLLKKNGKASRRRERWTMWYPIPGPDGEPVYPIDDDGRESRWGVSQPTVTRWLAEDADNADSLHANVIWKERPGRFVRTRPEPESAATDDALPRWRLEPDGSHWVPYTREWAPETPTRPWPTIWTASAASAAQQLAADALASEEASLLDPDGELLAALQEIAALQPLADVKTTRQAKAHLRALFPGVTAFETPKPEELMARIVEVATDPDDLVLDCFAGSGSTATAAHKLGRRWITCEWSRETVETFTLPRLQKVVAGEDDGGISGTVGWEGGGGFRVLDVAPSMFDEDEGLVVLSEWASDTVLSEATAAQLGFAYEEDGPFAGRKGKMRLAVIDGLVSRDVVDLLLSQLPEGERLTICATTIDDEAGDWLRERRRGSRVRKIPASLLAEYQRRARWRPPLDQEPARDAEAVEPGSGNGRKRQTKKPAEAVS